MQSLYDRLGVRYDNTRKADPRILHKLASHLRVQEGERYLDVACGTGNYTLGLASLGARMTGVDASREMVKAAKAKTSRSDQVEWRQAVAERLPFATGNFAGAVCVLGLHHFTEFGRALQEISRVLDPVIGRVVLFTSTPEQMSRYWLGRYFPVMMQRSAEQMPRLVDVTAALETAGLPQIRTEPYSVDDNLEDMFLYSGKHRPQLYLSMGFRAGISSFADLAGAAEVEKGLVWLADDIKSGRIQEVISAAENDGGDYLYVCAERC